jgi:adenine deaminase
MRSKVVLFLFIALLLAVSAPAQAMSPAPGRVATQGTISIDTQERQLAVQVAVGRAEADLVIKNTTLLNVYSLTWASAQDIVIAGNRVAWVGPTGSWAGVAKKTVSGYGYYAVPGFVESHNHIESSHQTPDEFARAVMPLGTTTNFEDSHEFGNVDGFNNTQFWFMPRQAGSPFKIFPNLGSAIPPTPFEHTGPGAYYDYAAVSKYLASDVMVPGLGEVMDGPSVTDPKHPGYPRIWGAMQATQEANRRVEGHMSGTFDIATISAFAAAGYSSDHSATTGFDAWDKLNRGIDIQISFGQGDTTGKTRKIITYLQRMGIRDWSHISLTTDDRPIEVILKIGSMDYNIRTAIEAGMPVDVAYAAASLYPAVHWRYDHLVGSITPGRYADIVLLRDPQTVDIYQVYANGKLMAQNGKMVAETPKINWENYPWATKTMNIGRELTANDFAIPANTPTVTAALLAPFYRETEFMTTTLTVDNGLVQRDEENGISKFCIVDRYNAQSDPVACMFWKDIGPIDENVAVASSVAHDHHNIWVLGSSDEAMALAVNHLASIGGGWTLVDDGKLVDEVAFEVGGLMTSRPPDVVAQDLNDFWVKVASIRWLGVSKAFDDPGYAAAATYRVYRQIFATLTCTPWKWVLVAPWSDCESGLRNVLTSECHEVVW